MPPGWAPSQDRVEIDEVLAAAPTRDGGQLHERDVAHVGDGEEARGCRGTGMDADAEEGQLGLAQQDGERVLRLLERLVLPVSGQDRVQREHVRLIGAEEVEVLGDAVSEMEGE